MNFSGKLVFSFISCTRNPWWLYHAGAVEWGAGLDLFHPGRGFDDWIPILVGNSQQKIYNAKVQKQMLIGQQCFLIYRRQSGICGHPCRQMSTGYVNFSLNGGIGWYWSVGSYQMVVQGQTATGEVRYEAHIRWPWLWSIAALPVFGQQKLGFLKLMALYGYIDFLIFDIHMFIYIYIYITDMWNINTNNLLCVYIYI